MDPQSPAAASTPKQGLAITSLVLGVLGNVCLWIFAGIPAIITGHVALSRARRSPKEYGGAGLAIGGLVLGYASLLVGTVILAILAGMLLPALSKAKEKAQRIQCVNNLKQIALAARIHSNDHNGQLPADFASMQPLLPDPSILVCPSDSRHTPLPRGNRSALTPANITYEFLTPSAQEDAVVSQPMFRCPIHGNVAMGDGSVQQGQGWPR